MNNHIYRIIRTKNQTSQKLKFYIDDIDQSSSLKETQALINSIIQIDYNAFLDSVYISQNNSSSFMMKSPKERKDIFAQILNLNDYDNLEKFTRNLLKDLMNTLEVKQQLLNSLINKISYKNEFNQNLNNYIDLLNKIDIDSIQMELEKLLKIQANNEIIKSKNQLILDQRNKLKNNINKYEKDIENNQYRLKSIVINDIQELTKQLNNINIDNIENESHHLQEQINDLTVEFNILRKELNELKNKKKNIVNYDKTRCEFCGNILSEEYKNHYIEELNERGKSISKNFIDIRNKLTDKQNLLAEKQNEYRKMKSDINDLNKQIQSSLVNKNEYDYLNQQINKAINELKLLKKDLEINLQEEIIPLDNVNTNNINRLKNEINILRNKQEEYNSKIAVLKDRLEQIEEYIIQVNELKKEINNILIEVDDYKSLINAFSKSGIQSYIIENVLPEIENEINDLLSDLTNNKISISFIVQKETKSKTTIDTLDLLVHESNVDRKYETFSGGEKFRIDFACHIGLSRFLAKRANANIDLFVLDENLGSQDETAKQIFIQYLTKLSKYFKMIIVITHINDVKEAFVNKLIIGKTDEKGSYIKS